MGRIKIGIIGCGHWGPNYIRVFQIIKDADVKCICDINKKSLKLIKDKYPYIKTTTNSREIIKDKSLDVVVIATPAITHYPLAREALASNKHILVEKPLTVNVEEAEELIRLSKKYGKVIMPGHVFEYHNGIREMKRHISERRLGKIYYMYSRRTNLGPIRNDVNAMWDLALHDISIFNFILDSTPFKISAKGFSYLRDNIEDIGFLTLYYPNDIIAHAHVSWLDPRKVREIVIVGNKKMFMFDDLNFLHPVKIYDKRIMKRKYERPYYTFEEFKMIIRNGPTVNPKVRMKEPLLVECETFLKYVKMGNIPDIYVRRGLEGVRVLIAAKKSMKKNGEEVKINTIT